MLAAIFLSPKYRASVQKARQAKPARLIMPLTSAIEDLKKTTLRSIAGILAKLDYFGRLRRSDGGYSHWGLSRVHGDAGAQQALADAHRNALSEVLRTPLRDLAEDAAKSSEQAGLPPTDYVEQLAGRKSEILPAVPGAGGERHFQSVLQALSALLKRR